MLKNRLIPVLFLKHGYLVRSEGFQLHQNLGNPVAQVERYNAWDVDELIYIDITPDDDYDRQREDKRIRSPSNFLEIISLVAQKTFMPLTVGGKIRSLDDIRVRMSLGADKVTINTMALRNPSFLSAAAKEFGSQAIVASIDVMRHATGAYEVFSDRGTFPTGRIPQEWARECAELGAGEIFLNSIDRDGKANGYDLSLVQHVVRCSPVPVIACGGVGQYSHFAQGITEGGASAVAAGNIFNFREMSYVLAKKELKKLNLNVR